MLFSFRHLGPSLLLMLLSGPALAGTIASTNTVAALVAAQQSRATDCGGHGKHAKPCSHPARSSAPGAAGLLPNAIRPLPKIFRTAVNAPPPGRHITLLPA